MPAQVEYDDGDAEEMEWDELSMWLVDENGTEAGPSAPVSDRLLSRTTRSEVAGNLCDVALSFVGWIPRHNQIAL